MARMAEKRCRERQSPAKAAKSAKNTKFGALKMNFRGILWVWGNRPADQIWKEKTLLFGVIFGREDIQNDHCAGVEHVDKEADKSECTQPFGNIQIIRGKEFLEEFFDFC